MSRRPAARRFLTVVIPQGPAPMTHIRGPMVPCIPALVISRVSATRTCGLLTEPALRRAGRDKGSGYRRPIGSHDNVAAPCRRSERDELISLAYLFLDRRRRFVARDG